MFKSKSLKVCLTLCILLFGKVSFAQNFFDRYAYSFVRNTCHISIDAFADFVENTKDDTPEYVFYMNPTNYIHPDRPMMIPDNNLFVRKGVGKNVARLLDSDGYYRGLRDCFPNSEFKRNLYTQTLLAFDALGKLATICIAGTISSGLFYGAAVAGSRSVVPAAVKTLRLLGVRQAVLESAPAAMRSGSLYLLSGAAIAALGRQIYSIKMQRELTVRTPQNSSSDFFIKTRRSLKENLDLYIFLQIQEFESKNSEERMEVNSIIQDQKENVRFYIEELLSDSSLKNEERENLVSLDLSLN